MIPLKKYLLSPLIFCTFLVHAQKKVVFEIDNSPIKDSSDKVFIAGNFNGWVPNDNSSELVHSTGKKKITLFLETGNYEYKFTRGEWAKGESDEKGGPINNRTVKINGDTTILVSIAGWSDHFNITSVSKNMYTASKNVHILDSAFYIPQLERFRRIWIYLPENYKISKKSYPVLYMHDGQNLFANSTSYSGEWGVDEFLDSMFTERRKQIIVVGIDNGQEKRMREYNPCDFQNFGKGEGDLYADFLVKTLKPFVDKNYRTRKNKKNTSIAGSSMGGLISLFTVLKYPNVYGSAGIFSPAFWTASCIDTTVIKNAKNLRSKLFFYAGGKEGDTMIPDIQRIEEEIKKVSKSPIKEVIDTNAKHHEAAWRKYFPVFYQWGIE
jgi:predicted alpha/beta superfamily hydrolase